MAVPVVISRAMDIPIKRITGTTFIAEIPRALGAVIELRAEKDRLVVKTESGIPFICGQTPRRAVEFSRPFAQGD